MTQAVELAKIIDRVDAATMLAEVEEGYSLSKASTYLTVMRYKREDFAKFRETHGDLITVAAIATVAAS